MQETIAASAVERARDAFAVVAQLEEAVSREPESRALHSNLLAMRKLALQAQERVLALAAEGWGGGNITDAISRQRVIASPAFRKALQAAGKKLNEG